MTRATLLFFAGTAIVTIAACPAPVTPIDQALSCTKDDDCAIGACGPCESGAPITEHSRMLSCVVNPCPSAKGHCTPARTCAVK